MSFCPICGTHHDPNFPCADRAGEVLRDAGIEPKPMPEKEFKETVKKANRNMVVILIFVLAVILLTVLLSKLK
jgi:hypothetical protein